MPDIDARLFERLDKDHPWFSPVDDAAEDMARRWMDLNVEDDDVIMEIIEDRAIELGISYADMERGDAEEIARHEAFEQACLKRAKIKIIKKLAEELEDM